METREAPVPLEYSGPNAEQIRYWNETSGPKWVALQELVDTQLRPIGRHAMDRAQVAAGERVLDVGCGCGSTALDLARRVGPTGSVTGVDISNVMLERARQAADEAGLSNLHFENADAQTYGFTAESFDVVFSRFGVMFFAQPAAAFRNLCRGLRGGGRLVFAAWQAMHLNPWMYVPMMAAAQHVTIPRPADPNAPGPAAFADAERVRGILAGAGFTDLAFEDLTDTLTVAGGADLDHTVDFLLHMGPTGNAIRDAGAGAGALTAVSAAIREALHPYVTPDGIRMRAAAWIVTGRRPA